MMGYIFLLFRLVSYTEATFPYRAVVGRDRFDECVIEKLSQISWLTI